jgi:hypothetical protein
VLLSVSFLLPAERGERTLGYVAVSVWWWEEIAEAPLARILVVLMPLFAGAVALAAALLARGRVRARWLLAVSGAVALAWFVPPAASWEPSGFSLPRSPQGRLCDLGRCLPLVAVAVGGHLRLRFPLDLLPRLVAVSGALGTFAWIGASFALDVVLPVAALAPALVYGGLAVAVALSRDESRILRTVLGWVHRFGLSALLLVPAFQFLPKLGCLLAGAAVLIALGPAAWLETVLIRRAQTRDPKLLVEVFR